MAPTRPHSHLLANDRFWPFSVVFVAGQERLVLQHLRHPREFGECPVLAADFGGGQLFLNLGNGNFLRCGDL